MIKIYFFFAKIQLFSNILVTQSGNNLRKLQRNGFSTLPRLICLYSLSNNLTEIEPGIFDNASELLLVNVSENRLNQLDQNLFRNCSSICNIDISANNFVNIEKANLPVDCSVEKLALNTNSIREIPECFANAGENLDHIELNRNRIERISKMAFTKSIGLQTLEMNYNRTELRLENGIFAENKRLIALEFYDSNISVIEAGTFVPLDLLQVLDLRKNRLTQLPRKFLSPNAILEWLQLDDNRIGVLNAASFQCLAILNMSLANNPIKNFPYDFFAGHKNTKTLNLSRISFRAQPLPDLSPLVELEQLEMNACEISYFQPQQFWPLENLNLLSLRENNFREFEMKAKKRSISDTKFVRRLSRCLESPLFGPANSLRSLFLSGCQIGYIGNKVFENLTKLKSLDLSSNRIRFLDKNMFADLYEIEIINLDDNRIENLFRNPFKSNRWLQTLSFSGRNRLRTFDTDIINGLKQLRELCVNIDCKIQLDKVVNTNLKIQYK